MKKTLFIGLGGCGLETIAPLSKKLAPKQSDEVKFSFLYIDTDDSTKKRINANGEIISATDFINLGATNPYKVYEQATKGTSPANRRILEWATSQEAGHLIFPNHSLADGAMAERMIGRTGFAKENGDPIKKALHDRIVAFQKHDEAGSDSVEADIWVVASSCGGTGSSLAIDILYLINKIANEKLKKDPYVKLVLYMPEPFIDHNRGKAFEMNNHSMNGYSFMWELNAFKQRALEDNKDIFTYFSAIPWGYKPGEQTEFFRFVMPVDVETNRNTKVGLENIYSTTAEIMYYLNVGSGALKIISNLSNDVQKSSKPNEDLEKYLDTSFKWGRWLIPYGYHVIRKADDELKKYLKTRATYEILRYGLLGEDLVNDAKVRDKAKRDFAGKYILPYLMDVDGFIAEEDDSVKTRINEEFNIGKLNTDGLDEKRVLGYIKKIDESLENTDSIKDDYLEKIKVAINKGIGNEVAEHGLQYTISLLQLVDDFYLTQLMSGQITKEQAESDDTAESLKASIMGFIGKGINKKNASAVAQACYNYFIAKKSSACAKISKSILVELTEFPDGYLEIIRKGNSFDKMGLKRLLDLINAKVGDARNAFSVLGKSFIDSQNDALTLYLPSLVKIAADENGQWAKDSEFEQLYYSSILDFDRERAIGVNGVRVPTRNNTSTNNLSSYIQQLLLKTDTALFVNLALADPMIAQNQLEKIISSVLPAIIDDAINTQGSTADTWLKRPLEEYIKLNEKDIDFETLTNPDLIPVMYPTKSTSEATLTRYLYVGSSLALAKRFGYVENGSNSEFVEDKQMTDRFQVIKLPVGHDFYSYKYFNKLQDHYFEHRNLVMAERAGCHIHKTFRFLDLDKALEIVKYNAQKAELAGQNPALLNAMHYFMKNLFYQHLIQVFKDKAPTAYNDLMGKYDSSLFASLFESKTDNNDGFDLEGFLAGPSGEENVSDYLGNSVIHDDFIKVYVHQLSQIDVEIVMRKFGIDTNGNFYAESDLGHFELSNVRSPRLFAEALLEATAKETGIPLMPLLTRIDEIEATLRKPDFQDAVSQCRVLAGQNALHPGTKEEPKFGWLIAYWAAQKHSDNEIFLNVIREFIKKAIR